MPVWASGLVPVSDTCREAAARSDATYDETNTFFGSDFVEKVLTALSVISEPFAFAGLRVARVCSRGW